MIGELKLARQQLDAKTEEVFANVQINELPEKDSAEGVPEGIHGSPTDGEVSHVGSGQREEVHSRQRGVKKTRGRRSKSRGDQASDGTDPKSVVTEGSKPEVGGQVRDAAE